MSFRCRRLAHLRPQGREVRLGRTAKVARPTCRHGSGVAMLAGVLPPSAAAGHQEVRIVLKCRERREVPLRPPGYPPSSLSPPVRSDEGGAAEPEAAAPHAKRPGVFRGTGRPRLLAGGRTPSASLRTTRAGPPRDPAGRWPRSSESSCAAPGRLRGFATGSPALPGGVAAPVPASGQRERVVASGIALTGTLTGRMG